MEKLRHFSLFSGIESFKKAMTNLGIENELVGYSEVDKYASVALAAIHGVDESLNYGDITKIDETQVPDCDLITYGFPCQDISVAGLGKGIIEGETRSGLLYDALRIIKHKKPKYAIAENVKNLVGKKFKNDFKGLLEELDSYGYNNYWKVLNSKDYGIPQNRERVFIVSIRKDIDTGDFSFPEGFDNGLRLKDFLENEVDEKFYISQEKTEKLISQIKLNNPNIKREQGKADGVYTNQSLSFTRPPLKDLSRTLKANVHDAAVVVQIGVNVSKQATVLDKETDIASTLLARDYKGFGNQSMTAVAEPMIVASRGRNLNNPSDRTVGSPTEQRLEPNMQGATNTLTTVQKDNLVLEKVVCEQRTDEGLRFFKDEVCGTIRTIDSGGDKRVIEKQTNELKLFANLEGGKWDKIHESARRVYDEEGISPTIPTCGGGNIEPKVQTDYKIRKLTPLECWRLMGFTDEDYRKARQELEDRFYNGRDRSNSQMYKMAGNSIVVEVLEGIFKQMLRRSN